MQDVCPYALLMNPQLGARTRPGPWTAAKQSPAMKVK